MDFDSILVLWEGVLERLRGLVNPQCFQTWFAPMKPTGYKEGVLQIEGPNPFFVDWLHEHHFEKIERAVREMVDSSTRVELTSPPNQPRVGPPERTPGGSMIIREPVVLPSKLHLNERYTFEEFIVGNCNRLAHASALAVAEKPAQAYNPLFIYGGAGLGKTHLI
jgi:chromosomal replication initiator protein